MQENTSSPHVLMFPVPVQGHLNAMLKLAELLSPAGLKITFLNSDHNQDRLLRYTDIHARFSQYPGFQFKTFSDGLTADHPRSGYRALEILDGVNLVARPILKELLTDTSSPVSCVIGDVIIRPLAEVVKELNIPLISFHTASASSFWAFICVPEIIKAGELPSKEENEEMDRPITSVPGMETFFRCRDLPSFCQVNYINERVLEMIMTMTLNSSPVVGLLLNTFEDLEGPIMSHIRTKFPKVYAIGPLHLHLKTRLASNMKSSQSLNSLWEMDRSCMAWLDKQPSQSVIYVSFGSLTVLTKEQYIEFWYGFVNSKQRFLWVIRPDSIIGGEAEIPMELVEATEERGYMVGWVPQEEVLAHKAVGAFFTHGGWNSTMESIVAGLPMLCWPYFADQPVNSRFVGEVWKLGLDMKDLSGRKVVEKMVNDLMVNRREEFEKSTDRMAKLAKKSVSVGGSSSCNLDRLIEDIQLMKVKEHDQ